MLVPRPCLGRTYKQLSLAAGQDGRGAAHLCTSGTRQPASTLLTCQYARDARALRSRVSEKPPAEMPGASWSCMRGPVPLVASRRDGLVGAGWIPSMGGAGHGSLQRVEPGPGLP